MSRIHLKHGIRLPKVKKKSVFFLGLFFCVIGIIALLNFFNQKFTPILMKQAEVQARRIILLVLTQAVSEQINVQETLDDLFIVSKNEDGTVKAIDYNPIGMNKLLTYVSNNVRKYLQNLESGQIDDIKFTNTSYENSLSKLKNGIVSEIPSGIVFHNSLLSNLGPKIPVRLNLIGDIQTDLKTNVTNYGINNALIEVVARVQVSEQVILPFQNKAITITSDIPVAVKVIQGSVPNYYFNGGENPKIALPSS